MGGLHDRRKTKKSKDRSLILLAQAGSRTVKHPGEAEKTGGVAGSSWVLFFDNWIMLTQDKAIKPPVNYKSREEFTNS